MREANRKSRTVGVPKNKMQKLFQGVSDKYVKCYKQVNHDKDSDLTIRFNSMKTVNDLDKRDGRLCPVESHS